MKSARRKLRQVKQSGDHSPEQIKNFAVNFLNLVRLHSKLKRASMKSAEKKFRGSMQFQCAFFKAAA